MSEENKTNAMEEKPESVQTEDKKETLQAKTGKKERKKDKKKREDQELKGLSMKERKKVLEARKEKRRRKWYIAIAIVVAVLIAGLLCLIAALFIQGLFSVLLGLLGVACIWSIRELKEQARRVERGWFPKNPKRK